MRILLAEDEHGLGEWLSRALAQSGFQVDWHDDGRIAEQAARDGDYDALVLDLGLPGRGGHEVLKRLRASGASVPVLILTARDSLAERVGTLNEGAELEARLTALIRRARGSERPRLACGPLQFDTGLRQFTLGDEVMQLSPREHSLLRALVVRSGEPMSRQQLVDRVFGDEDEVQAGALDVLMHRLRRRLDGGGVRIQTYRGLGYALEPDPDPDPVALPRRDA